MKEKAINKTSATRATVLFCYSFPLKKSKRRWFDPKWFLTAFFYFYVKNSIKDTYGLNHKAHLRRMHTPFVIANDEKNEDVHIVRGNWAEV